MFERALRKRLGLYPASGVDVLGKSTCDPEALIHFAVGGTDLTAGDLAVQNTQGISGDYCSVMLCVRVMQYAEIDDPELILRVARALGYKADSNSHILDPRRSAKAEVCELERVSPLYKRERMPEYWQRLDI